MSYINTSVVVVHERKILKDLSKCPLEWSLKGQPPDFNKSEFQFPKEASY